MHRLPYHLYRAGQVRELDRIAIDEFGIPSAELMARAGAAAFGALRWRWPDARRIAVLCGTGNNGGDGYVVARLAQQAGLETSVFQLGDVSRVRGAAAEAAEALRASGVSAAAYEGQALHGHEVIVDAMLGTGLERDVTGRYRDAIETVGKGAGRVLAIDIPSGLDADTGRVMGAAIRADVTVSFIGLKQGLFTGAGPECSGEVRCSDLGLPADILRRVIPSAMRLSLDALALALAPRRRSAHKGDYGHVLVIGGDHGMMGAALLAGEAAARSGAGLVSVATRAAHAPAMSAARPELMAHGVDEAAGLRPLLARANVVAIGPGLGRSAWGRAMLGYALDSDLPLVVDADALNLLAAEPARRENWVITPHPGEAARLLGSAAADIERDRFAAVRRLQERYGGVAVLKGAGTLVCSPDGVVGVCDRGNPGMAGGGMGDLLTGVIAGLIAQGIDPADATCLGVLLHAEAGDRAAAAGGERGLLASDLLPRLRALINPTGR